MLSSKFRPSWVSAVTVSRDLAYADVYITSLGLKDEFDQEKIVDVLNKAQGFLRSRLAGRIQLRAVPALRFHYDESIERGKGLSALIDKAIAEDAEHPANKSEEQ